MQNERQKTSLCVGVGLIVVGILFNKWFIEAALVPDRNIENWKTASGIFVLQASVIALGVFLVVKRPLGIRELLTSLLSLLFSFTLIDLLLGFALPPAYPATRYGWTVSGGTTSRTVQDTSNNLRTVTRTYAENGFRRWGDTNTDGVKALIIGDSFTQMSWVSNGEEWYSYIERAFPQLELFVYGGGGYGSLQEFMVLDDHIDQIDPNLIIWQFCGNDYWNNLYELDKSYYPHNNIAVRPYLEHGRIVYRLPVPFAGIRRISFTADRLGSRLDLLVRERMGPPQWDVAVMERRRGLENQAFEITEQIMLKVGRRAGNRPIYMFNACGPLTEQERRIADMAQIGYMAGISESVRSMEDSGVEVIVVNEGHWNRNGNLFAGGALVDALESIDEVSSMIGVELTP